jgi:formylglycine-generating enzyme required for sulfatase activity
MAERAQADAAAEAPVDAAAGIGAAGGSLTLPGGAQITLPPSAVSGGVSVHAAVVSPPVASTAAGLVQKGSVYAFTPHGTTFTKPAKIRIPASAPGGAVYSLANERDPAWKAVDGVTRSGGFYEFAVTHISLFAEFVTATAADAGSDASEPSTPRDASADGNGGSVDVSPSCRDLAANCGPEHDESCCVSPLVPGGTFERGSYGGIYTQSSPNTISGFRLDKYEVTVGRFRKFVNAFTAGWRPEAGSGKHAHLNGGQGLAGYPVTGQAATYEPGWVAPHSGLYSDFVWPMPATAAAWNTRLLSTTGCDVLDDGGGLSDPSLVACMFCKDAPNSPCFQTWTPTPEDNENRPINQLQWIEAYAFCIWDGGFLPSEAETEYADFGGSEKRPYPWGTTVPGSNAELLVQGCLYDDRPDHQPHAPDGSRLECTGIHNIAPVGSIPAGNGKWGQADLAGNVDEWVVDSQLYSQPPACTDCAYFSVCGDSCSEGKGTMGGKNFERGGSNYTIQPIGTNGGGSYSRGVRCARLP